MSASPFKDIRTSSIRPPSHSSWSISPASPRSGRASPGKPSSWGWCSTGCASLRSAPAITAISRIAPIRPAAVFQFILALLAQSTAQKSVLWWAAKHRHHHLHSDTEDDVHSPRHTGFLYSHRGLDFLAPSRTDDLIKVADFAQISRTDVAAPTTSSCRRSCWRYCAFSSAAGRAWWSASSGARSLVYHATFCINSLAHVRGRKRYVTGDDSRNNWLLALFTMGEGWHNNHHAYQSSVRQGFHWWEIDPTYYLLKVPVLAWHRLGPEEAAGTGSPQRATARRARHQSGGRAARGALQCRADRARRDLSRSERATVGPAGDARSRRSPSRRGVGAAASATHSEPRGMPGPGKSAVCKDAVARRHRRPGP